MSNPKKSGTEPDLDLLNAIPPEMIPAAIAHLAARAMAAPATYGVNPSVTDDLLTPQHAAALLHVSRKYIYAHTKDLGGVRLRDARGRIGPHAPIRFQRSKVLQRIGR